MANLTSVVIGIQARSTSKRFPRKVFETVGGKAIINHVIDACDSAAYYINKHTHKSRVMVSVALLVPFQDELAQMFKKRMIVIEGSEDDVLSRFKLAKERLHADYMVRVTADCPLLPPFLITKHINTAILNGYDYVSNVDEQFRTAVDGHDVEVLSSKLIDYLDKEAHESKDREHVTTLARSAPPEWAKIGYVVNHINLSRFKLSVDTLEDLERVRAEFDQVQKLIEKAEQMRGKTNVHRF